MTTNEVENANIENIDTPVKVKKAKGPLRSVASKAKKALWPKKSSLSASPASLDVSLTAPCAFDIEVEAKEDAQAPMDLVARLNEKPTALADSAESRHSGAAARRAATLAARKEKAAAQKLRAEAAAARRAAPSSSDAPIVEEVAEPEEPTEDDEISEDDKDTSATEADAKKGGRTSLMGRLSRLSKGPISMLTPRKTPRQAPAPELPAPIAFDIDMEKREGATPPEGLLERLLSKRASLAATALTRHSGAAERRAAMAAAKQAKAAARNAKAHAAAARRFERAETLAEKVAAKMAGATARATTTLIIRAAVAGVANAKVGDAAVRRSALKEAAAVTLGAEMAALLIDQGIAADAKAAAARDGGAKGSGKSHGFLKMFKLPRLFGGARAA